MPEPANPNPNPSGGDNPPANPNPTPEPGKPNPSPNPGGTGGEFDPSKLSDEQLNKVLEDQRLWNTPRLKELREAQKQLKTQQEQAQKAEEERLKKQGEFEKLATQHEESAKSWQEKYTNAVTDNAIIVEATKAGITDLDAAKKLIDRGEIKIADDGTISGVAEAIAALAKEKPYLVGTPTKPNVGSGTNPTNVPPANGGQFTMSQIMDPVFYQQHHAEIQKAMATGQIIEDRA